MKNSYLGRLFSEFRALFVVVVLLLLGTAYFALKSHEEFPFLLYGMYSLKENPKENYISYAIVIDGKEVNYSHLWDAQCELIQSRLSEYAARKQEGSISATDEENFHAWLYRYCADMRMIEENSMDVYELNSQYNLGIPAITGRKLLFSYHAN